MSLFYGLKGFSETYRKCYNYHYRDSWKSDNFSKSNQDKKQRADTKIEEKQLRAITSQGANERKANIEKNNNWMAL